MLLYFGGVLVKLPHRLVLDARASFITPDGRIVAYADGGTFTRKIDMVAYYRVFDDGVLNGAVCLHNAVLYPCIPDMRMAPYRNIRA